MAGTIGTNVAKGAVATAGGQAGGFTRFPIGVGGGGGTQAAGNTRMPPQQIQRHMMGQLENVEVPQGRPTGGTGFHSRWAMVCWLASLSAPLPGARHSTTYPSETQTKHKGFGM